MKRILVLSDSHSGNSFMRWCVDSVKPDAIVHLGDYYEDACDLHEEYPMIPFYSVPGNCDRYRVPPHVREVVIENIFGVDMLLTHGHKHWVKQGTELLVRAAQEAGVRAALYGHAHIPDCLKEGALWVLNPGASGSWGGSAGIIEVENGRIISCRHYRYGDQEELK
jgi:putative phosphoesterase